ncbi:hypothetical protein HII28_10315 [Planctomonas sp. JC2975]|uniref:hypothetical protein n=1 Tax=Planctomonas sp. JC2975 TaxID=2729626 RepID=UPI001472DB23|nr:hypothetical protein [Planctomonas sp. JC2975]NNC12269.1 hypothetical protein [Planctomonas sp. JC2975]
MTETVETTSDQARRQRAALRPVRTLLAVYFGVSAAMIVAIGVLSALGNAQDPAVWIRCSLVLGSAAVLLAIMARATRGSRSALIRLRIITPVVLAAIIVIVSIPGFLPGWVRIEQGLCGAILLPAVILLFLPRTAALSRREA